MTAPAPERVRSGWDRPRLLLAVVWLGLLLTALAVREDETSLAALYDDVRSGRVERVELVGGLGAYGAGLGQRSGSAQLDAHWVVDGDHRRAELVEVAGSTSVSTDGREVTTDDVRSRLAALDPDLQLDVSAYRSGWSASLLGARVPGVLVPVVLGSGLATLVLLVAGPEPWRATRWAWFWLAPVPFAVVAFCLLSGPTPGVPAPRREKRLTGGWAFLLAGLLGGVVGALLGVAPGQA